MATLASTKAYLDGVESGSFESKKLQVYHFIKSQPSGATKDDVIAGLKMPHKTVTARISELHDAGEIDVLFNLESLTLYHVNLCLKRKQEIIRERSQEKDMRHIKYLENRYKGTPLETPIGYIKAYANQY